MFAPAGIPYDPVKHIVYYPPETSVGNWGGGLAGWDRVPYAHDNFGFDTPPLTGDDMDAFREYEDETGFKASEGIGDICRYISSKEGWVEGKWRLPTSQELDLLYNETPTKPQLPVGGDFVNVTADYNSHADNHRDGKSLLNSGLQLGAKASGSIVPDRDKKTPPSGTVYLPVSGHRYPNGDGDVVHIGAYGYYWSSTPYDGITVNYPLLYRGGLEFYDADRSYAYPIRCIRDY